MSSVTDLLSREIGGTASRVDGLLHVGNGKNGIKATTGHLVC